VEDADCEVLKHVGNVLQPGMVDEVIGEMRALLAPNELDATRGRNEKELSEAELEVERFAEAIALAGDVPAVVRRLQKAEQWRQTVAKRLEDLQNGPGVAGVDWRLVERQARQRLVDWRALLQRQPAHGRQVLREVLEEPILFTQATDGHRRWYRVQGKASLGGAFQGLTEVIGLASPRGTSQRGTLPILGVAA
jgi:hypothetical protein